MRRTCLKQVYELAKQDDRVVFIGSDITKNDLADFQEEFPERCIIEGIYEQHIMGMAAGLAFCGMIPFINTIATFITRRSFEQIFIDLCLHDLPVRLIGSGGGTVYAPLGGTHITNEDIGILRMIPNMTIIAPSDAKEMERLMPKTLDWPHPIYIRLAKGGDPIISSNNPHFEIGKAIKIRSGKDGLLISTGITTNIAIQAADELSNDGIDVSVLHVHTIKPLDVDMILEEISKVSVILTIEEHKTIGGLGGAISELIAEGNYNPGKKFKRIGFPNVFTEELGSQNEIMEKYGITSQNIITKTN